MRTKFEVKDNRPVKEKVSFFLAGLLFWKGRKKGMVHTMHIGWREIRPIFFPKGFYDKYSYLGTIPYNEDGDCFKAIYPLVLAMDYEAKPKWCPRWFLRFLHLFGNDNSIVRVRNRSLNNLYKKITKGIMFWDYKTKWNDYDLRISIVAPKHLQDLADDIEHGFYSRGRQEELVAKIKRLNPNESIFWGSIDRLEKQLAKLENKHGKQQSK